jgi:hypothetical protein
MSAGKDDPENLTLVDDDEQEPFVESADGNLQRRMRRPKSARERLAACFTCEAFLFVLADYIFCFPRYVCEVFPLCGCCPRRDPFNRKTCPCPPNTRLLNVIAAVLHLLLAIFATIVLLIQSSTPRGEQRLFRVTLEWSMPVRDFSAPEYQSPVVQDYLNNRCLLSDGTLTCPGNSDETIFDFFDCVLDQNGTTQETVSDAFSLATPTKREGYEFPFAFYVLYLVIAFSLITSMFHFSLATCCFSFYESELAAKRQPLRWLEYSITASIMMVIVLQLNSVTDPFILGSAICLVASYNTLGAAMEYPEVKQWGVRVWFYAISTLGFAMTFLTGFLYYYAAVSPWFDLGECSAWGDLFNFVSIAVWSLFGSYLTFPLLDTIKHAFLCCTERGAFGYADDSAMVTLDEPDDELTCCWRCFVDKNETLRGIALHEKRRVDAYRCAEVGYIVLSFVSKTILVGIVGIAALGRGGD